MRAWPAHEAIQETYKEIGKTRRAMMELYKREKINPLAAACRWSCKFGVHLVLLGAARERGDAQAPFMLWINDLSSRDPYFVLPLLMARHVRPVQVESAAARSDAGQAHAVHALVMTA